MREARLGWLLCAPMLIAYAAVAGYPIASALWLSLHRYDLRFSEASEFVGLANLRGRARFSRLVARARQYRRRYGRLGRVRASPWPRDRGLPSSRHGWPRPGAGRRARAVFVPDRGCRARVEVRIRPDNRVRQPVARHDRSMVLGALVGVRGRRPDRDLEDDSIRRAAPPRWACAGTRGSAQGSASRWRIGGANLLARNTAAAAAGDPNCVALPAHRCFAHLRYGICADARRT